MAKIFTSSVIGAALITFGSGAHGSPERPVKLVTEETDRGILVHVIGESPVDVSLRYRLELRGRSGAGNSVNQGGSATLRGGDEPHILATIRMSGKEHEGRLIVQFADGGGYEAAIGLGEKATRP